MDDDGGGEERICHQLVSSVHLLVSTHSNGPNVIRPCASSSKSFCCMKYIFVIPRLCGSVYDPSSEYHLFSMTSQLHD